MRSLRPYFAWMWIAAAVAVVATVNLLTTGAGGGGPPLSVENARGDGALALYLWLGRTGRNVRLETATDLGLGGLRSGGDTLMVLTPVANLSTSQTGAVLRWVAGGGSVVLATEGDTATGLTRRLGLVVVPTSAAPVRVTQPLLLAPATARLAGSAPAVLPFGVTGVGIVSSAYGSVLLKRRWGRGQVWMCTARMLLDNAHLGRADNRRLALNLVGSTGSTVAFDEFRPAGSSTPSNWLFGTPWGITLVFAVAVLLLYRWLAGRRLGPPLVPLADSQRPAAEYVVSVAGLLRRAHRRDEVLRRYQRELRRTLQEQSSAKSRLEALPDLGRLLSTPGDLSEKELLRRVGEIVQCEEQLRRTRV